MKDIPNSDLKKYKSIRARLRLILPKKGERFPYVLFAVLLSFDQVTKMVIRHQFKPYDGVIVSPNYLFLENVPNRGGPFGFLSGHSVIITLCCSILVIGFLYISRWHNRLSKLGLYLFIAGSVSNLIDRLFYGAVTDFIYQPSLNLHLNLADLMVLFGMIIYCLSELTQVDRK